MRKLLRLLLCGALGFTSSASSWGAGVRRAENRAAVAELPSPAGTGSATPNLATTADALYLSWLQALEEGGHELRLSRYDGVRWSTPRTIVRSSSLFVNWADFPSILALGDGSLAAHWLEKGGEGPYEYNVKVSRSTDEKMAQMGGGAHPAHRGKDPRQEGGRRPEELILSSRCPSRGVAATQRAPPLGCYRAA